MLRRVLFYTILFIFLIAVPTQNARATILGNIEIDPKILNFGDTLIGDSSQGTETVRKKSGFFDVFVFGSFLTHPFGFSRDGQDCVNKLLTNNNDCQIFGTFSPNRRAFYHTHLVVVGTSREIFDFASWIGRGVRPKVDVDPTSIDFGEQPTDMPSGPQSVNVQNVGTGPLIVSNVSLLDGTEFSLGNETCTAAPVDPGNSCSIEVIFGPSMIGNFTDTLQITDNAQDSPQEVALEGEGIAPLMPAITLSASELDFDLQAVGVTSAPMEVTLTNSGSGDLDLTGISVSSGGNDYSQSNDCGPFPATLMPGEFCTISNIFTPTAIGELLGDVTITATGLSDEHITLEGIGFIPGSGDFSLSVNNLNFGEFNVGEQTGPQTVTVTNTGSEPLNFASIVFGGNDPSSFSMIDECGDDPLLIGDTCIIEVYFGPQEDGALTATITLTDQNGQVQTITLNGVGIGTGGGDVGGGGGFCALNKDGVSSGGGLTLILASGLLLMAWAIRRRVLRT